MSNAVVESEKMDSKEKKKTNISGEEFKKLQTKILLVFAVVSFLSILIVAFGIFKQAQDTTIRKVSELVSADSEQLELNIDQYMQNVEKNAMLLFADADYYEYDATDTTISDYDRILLEEKISKRIIDISLMENYSDFGIIYANNQTTGWFSSTTSNMFPDGDMYESFSSYISDGVSQSAWLFGVKDNKDRFYYVKRLNPNAVLVVSFFSRELGEVFEFPEELEGMTVRLVDDKDQIIFSSEPSEIGKLLPENLQNVEFTGNRSSVVTPESLINANTCENGWKVYTSISREFLLKDSRRTQVITLIVALSAAGLVVGIGVLLIRNMTGKVSGIVMTLQEKATVDQLSGTWNKSTFQQLVQKKLATAQDSEAVLMMIDMDNFKNVNDLLGHKKGDEIISRLGCLLTKSLGKRYEVGRLGGDEFAVYGEFTNDRKDIRSLIEADIQMMTQEFKQEFLGEANSCDISLSIGIYREANTQETFETLYERADSALYIAKRTGKNKYVFYGEEEK